MADERRQTGVDGDAAVDRLQVEQPGNKLLILLVVKTSFANESSGKFADVSLAAAVEELYHLPDPRDSEHLLEDRILAGSLEPQMPATR